MESRETRWSVGRARGRWRGVLAAALLASAFGTSRADAHSQLRATSNLNDRTFFQTTMDDLGARHIDLDAVLWKTNGDWYVVGGTETYNSSGFPATLVSNVRTRLNQGHRVVAGDCNAAGSCVVIFEDWISRTNGSSVPSCFSSILDTYTSNGWPIRDVEITGNACVFLGAGSLATYQNIDPELARAIFDRRASGRNIDALSIGFNDEWALVADHNPMYSGIDSRLRDQLESVAQTATNEPHALIIGEGDNYLWYSGSSDSTSTSTPIGNIEYGLSGSSNIWARLAALGLPGVAVGLIEDTASGPAVTTARGYGLRRSDGDLPILARTPFALASLSKYLGALLLADHEETDATVTSTTDLLTANLLPSTGSFHTWRVAGENPNSNFAMNLPATIGGASLRSTLSSGITLDRLLVHTAGIVSEDDGSSLVESRQWASSNSLPTSTWLFGRSCQNGCSTYGNSVWQVAASPAAFNYDSANYLVAQAHLEDRTGLNIHDRLSDRIFDPIGMPDTFSRIALSATQQAEVAWKHSGSTPQTFLLNSAWPLAGGIWSSAQDYANAMIVALNTGSAANGTQILTVTTNRNRILRSPTGSGMTRGWGVDFEGVTSVEEGTNRPFWHNGSNAGARTHMCANPTTNQGIVILVNSDAAGANTLINEILAAYLARMSWASGFDCSG